MVDGLYQLEGVGGKERVPGIVKRGEERRADKADNWDGVGVTKS